MKIRPKKKIQACMGVERMTSVIPVQCSTCTAPADYLLLLSLLLLPRSLTLSLLLFTAQSNHL